MKLFAYFQHLLLQGEPCDICGDVGFEEDITTCFQCKIAREHCYCMRKVLLTIPEIWFCKECQSSNGIASSKSVKAEHVPMALTPNASETESPSWFLKNSRGECHLASISNAFESASPSMFLNNQEIAGRDGAIMAIETRKMKFISTEEAIEMTSCTHKLKHSLRNADTSTMSRQTKNVEENVSPNNVEEPERSDDDSLPQLQMTTKKRKTRGRTTMPALDKLRSEQKKLQVEFNSKEQPVGYAAKKMAGYIGILVRSIVPITVKNWRMVTDEQKQKIWDLVLENFELEAKAKKIVLKSAGLKWRGFKARLTKYILSNKDKKDMLTQPPASFKDVILQPQWDAFVRTRLSNEFKKVSEEQKQIRAKMIYHHRLSRNGYANLEREIQQSLGTSTEVTRSILWKKAHATKSGEYPDEATQEMANKIDEYSMKCSKGTIPTGFGVDALTLAFGGTERPGRVRGVGSFVSPTMYFHAPKTKNKKPKKAEILLEAQKKFCEEQLAQQRQLFEQERNELRERLAALEAKMAAIATTSLPIPN
ncbi:uncharacterized protein LOC111317652 [Durio zibethinus]|uniref:Uncharacterized protein LOC111317652 n=1 Tax=Durio zibethinus TaxID=66656 RepID=A0A6P6BFF1_DURZI|nr:uncharacterized protein LOC111317652 [Durio zibethinus]